VLPAIGGFVLNRAFAAILIGIPNLVAMAVLGSLDGGPMTYALVLGIIVTAGSAALFATGRAFGRRQQLSMAFAVGAALAPAVALLTSLEQLLDPDPIGLTLYGTYLLSSAALPAGFIHVRRARAPVGGNIVSSQSDIDD
jgi:hypothetical protein